MKPGCDTAHWNDCSAPIENPATARTCVTPRCSSTRRDASTLSRMAMAGKSGPACGAGVLLGDDETPLPNISVVTMNVARRIEGLAGADDEVVDVVVGAVRRGQQHRVVAGGVERAEGGVGDARLRQHPAALEAEVGDLEEAALRIGRRAGACACSDEAGPGERDHEARTAACDMGGLPRAADDTPAILPVGRPHPIRGAFPSAGPASQARAFARPCGIRAGVRDDCPETDALPRSPPRRRHAPRRARAAMCLVTALLRPHRLRVDARRPGRPRRRRRPRPPGPPRGAAARPGATPSPPPTPKVTMATSQRRHQDRLRGDRHRPGADAGSRRRPDARHRGRTAATSIASRKSFTVITLDLRGTGDSDKPVKPGAYALDADARRPAGRGRRRQGATLPPVGLRARRGDRPLPGGAVGPGDLRGARRHAMGPPVEGMVRDAILGMRTKWMPVIEAQAAGTLDKSKLSPGDVVALEGGVAVIDADARVDGRLSGARAQPRSRRRRCG